MKNIIEVKIYIGLLIVLISTSVGAGADQFCQYLHDSGSVDSGLDVCSNHIPIKHKSLNQVISTKAAATASTSFIFEMKNDNFFTHAVDNFSAQTYIGGVTASIYAMAFDETGDVLYGLENTYKELVTINQTNGALTVVGPLTNIVANDYVSGIDITPDGTCYVTSNNGITSSLYTCDLTTGTLTLVGTQSTTPLLIGIAADCDGNIYGHDIVHDSMYSINSLTGAATVIGLTGLDASNAQDITYDRQEKKLYGYIYTGSTTNTYGSIDICTGAVTPLTVNNPLGEYAGASKTDCALSDVIFRGGFDC